MEKGIAENVRELALHGKPQTPFYMVGRNCRQWGILIVVTRKNNCRWTKGPQFFCRAFKKWCKRKNIRPRYGAVGQYGSIAVIERFIRSMKSECTRRIMVPLRLADFRQELALYLAWYNEVRPHQGIKGKTPNELYFGISHAPPNLDIRDPNLKLNLHVSFMHHRPHLPIVALKIAA